MAAVKETRSVLFALFAELALLSCRAQTPSPAVARTRVALDAGSATEPRRSTVREQWREQWQLHAELVADLGDSLLVRADTTTSDVRFALHDARTGSLLRPVSWLDTALPDGERNLVDRLSFAAPWVAIVEGADRRVTTLRAIATGEERWQIRGEQRLWLRAIDDAPIAIVTGASRIARHDPSNGAVLWQQIATQREVEALGASRDQLVLLERAARVGRASLVARSLSSGAIAWRHELAFDWDAPVFFAQTRDHWWFAKEQSVWALARDTGAIARTFSLESGVQSLHGLDAIAIVSTVSRTVQALSANSDVAAWSRTDEVECVLTTRERAFVVRRFGAWSELDTRDGRVLFEHGGGHCQWQHNAITRGSPVAQLLLTQPNTVRSFQASERAVEERVVHVDGALTLDDAPAANVSVWLATQHAVTDARGRFTFAISSRGSWRLHVDVRAMTPATRCVCTDETVMIEHRGAAETRAIRARYRSYEPMGPTRCSSM